MKEIWFQHLLENKSYWPFGVTEKRLLKNKELILADEPTMSDLLIRHGGDKLKPFEMKEQKELYEHCMSNFACNCLTIVKPL